MTNEQAVIEAGKDIARLKAKYVEHITPIVVAYELQKIQPTLPELLECQRVGNEYFNYVERFVGDSGLLGAHANGKWVTGFAEDCREILESYISHMIFIRSWQPVLGTCSEPSSNAFSNMQRMVVEYLTKEQSKEIEQKFIANSLPIQGFKVKAVPDKAKFPKWQLVTSVVIGCLSLISSVVIALLVPEPTSYQEFILRGLFAIALASIASIIPGFINVKSGARSGAAYFGIYAGGAVAIFVLIWLFNPPKIDETTTNNPPVILSQQNS
ncbi:hypothetical protein RGL59_004389 [Vibrio parahaemolyticus]|nr:hypothetical protein [Vibrio parahaemolyticus]EJC7056762.1 hypothetical protein [Vibrio parahaemolyticus]EJC7100094.1 hypothetical protein [Vibrio parahaemolyticus]EJC7113914.1 hypothetical protein [Vibrio parahaemolyticus]EJC7133144.1 hypothetical protein [Vibrio parahaemolyticus]